MLSLIQCVWLSFALAISEYAIIWNSAQGGILLSTLTRARNISITITVHTNEVQTSIAMAAQILIPNISFQSPSFCRTFTKGIGEISSPVEIGLRKTVFA
ncbi:MAG: hypothetical protein CMQ45_08875 [Gammaproteobacteria bacterium]|nr:hypothetical protein [Gammaproteobacteria bacterium]